MKILQKVPQTANSKFIFQGSPEYKESAPCKHDSKELCALLVEMKAVESLKAQDLVPLMKEMGIDSSYKSRLNIARTLHDNGVELFKFQYHAQTGAPVSFASIGTLYIGQPQQNATFARNLEANRHLFENGVLQVDRASEWKVVS